MNLNNAEATLKLQKERDRIKMELIGCDLREYYLNGCPEGKMKDAVKQIEDKDYFEVILLYYGEGKTVYETAEELGVDITTVSRNKKELVLLVGKLMENDTAPPGSVSN